MTMRRAKLERIIDILKLLNKQPQKITHISQKVNINQAVLLEYLEFMIKQQLIKSESITPKRKVFMITERGKTTLGFFKEIEQVAQIETIPITKVRKRSQ